jgi:hypothetical protein
VSARTVRAVVVAVCAAGVAGMIVASVAERNGAALTFGLVTAAAVACLIVATAVAPPTPRSDRVEALVAELVAGGADERTVRALVAEAAGRSRPPAVPSKPTET